MTHSLLSKPLYSGLSTILFFLVVLGILPTATGQSPRVRQIVIVHGALVDGSTWSAVYQRLTAKGYQVTVVQNPLTSLDDDLAAVQRTLDKLTGPVILVGHSWGGTVITEAGNSPKVVGLVYVAAFQPDAGESSFDQFSSAPAFPENCLLSPDAYGLIYGDKAKFRAGFAADVPQPLMSFMADSQLPLAAKALGTKIKQAAWRTKPSWGIIPTADKSINPLIERAAYQRSKTVITEVKGASHCVYISQPAVVANVIVAAATHVPQP